MGVKHLALVISILTVLTAGQSSARAGKQKAVADSTILADVVAGPFQDVDEELLDPITGQLLWQLSHKPELMTPDYLNYYLGPPDKQTSRTGVRSHAFYWYDRTRHLRCELYQEEDKPGQVVEAQTLFHLPPNNDFDFDVTDDALGPPARKFFDHVGFPTQMYSYVPDTTLAMATEPNSYSITKATVTYLGAPLPRPSAEDMQLAHDSFIARVQATQVPVKAKGGRVDWSQTLELARSRVGEQPADAAAHANLAEVLKRTGNVHEAIGEYKYALTLNKYNEPIRQQCIQGLKDLYVLPQDYGSDASTEVAGKRPLKFTHNGQRMRVAGSPDASSN